MSGNGEKEKKAVVLLSGGLDSTTVLAIARDRGFACHCLSFAYGQRQRVELDRAARVAAEMGAARHLVLRLDLDRIGGSALTDHDIDVPLDRGGAEMRDIPATYVPGRNAIFLAHAAAFAEVIGSRDIFIGVNAVDYSGYPDCRPEFITAIEKAFNLGTKAGSEGKKFTIHAPLIRMSKKEIIETGLALGVDYSITHSCYAPDGLGRACGRCDACRLRLAGFAAAGVEDPAPYQPREEEP